MNTRRLVWRGVGIGIGGVLGAGVCSAAGWVIGGVLGAGLLGLIFGMATFYVGGIGAIYGLYAGWVGGSILGAAAGGILGVILGGFNGGAAASAILGKPRMAPDTCGNNLT
jgi:hypothetical protein